MLGDMFNGLQWHVYVVDAEGEGGWGALGFLGCWEGRVCGGGGRLGVRGARSWVGWKSFRKGT